MSTPEIRASLLYVSRRWRGLWRDVDQVQDLVEALKAGEAWAARSAAQALAPALSRVTTRGTFITAAPRSRPDRPSLAPLVKHLAELLGCVAVAPLLERAEPVPSSRLLRRGGLAGVCAERHASTICAVGPVPRGPVVVIDDVVTTGATLMACQQVLRRAGCPSAIALAALARASRPPFERAPDPPSGKAR